jgi:CO/xanthine dehydrogenase FAD-binding subunit
MAMKHRTATPRCVVSLKRLPDLDRISSGADQGLQIGALVTHQTVVDSPLIRERWGALWTACAKVGTPTIRNMGTLGGNLCNAAPSADTAPPLIAYRAQVTVRGVTGERRLPLDTFFRAPGSNALTSGEVLVAIDVPRLPPRSGAAYVKLPARSAVDIAAVGVAACVTLDAQGACQGVSIVLGAVAPTPMRAKEAEALLQGKTLTEALLQTAARRAAEEARPISDVRASATYRKEMVQVLTREALQKALHQAQSG